MEVLVAPDPVKLALSYFSEHGVNATKNRPNPVTGDIVTIRRIGGGTVEMGIVDQPWLYVEALAATDEDAADLGALAWGLLMSMRGEVIDGVQCYDATPISGPADMPDADAQQPRVVMTAQLSLRTTAWTPPASV